MDRLLVVPSNEMEWTSNLLVVRTHFELWLIFLHFHSSLWTLFFVRNFLFLVLNIHSSNGYSKPTSSSIPFLMIKSVSLINYDMHGLFNNSFVEHSIRFASRWISKKNSIIGLCIELCVQNKTFADKNLKLTNIGNSIFPKPVTSFNSLSTNQNSTDNIASGVSSFSPKVFW